MNSSNSPIPEFPIPSPAGIPDANPAIVSTTQQRPQETGFADIFVPKAPQSLDEAGLHSNDVYPIILKFLFLHGVNSGRRISEQVKLPFGLVLPILEQLKQEILIARKSVVGIGDYVYELTTKGVDQAKLALNRSTYCGAAAVGLTDYALSVKTQSLRNYRPTLHDVAAAMSDLMVSKLMLSQLGQAINSGRSLFLFGAPGNGKTSIARRAIKSVSEYIWIPRALTVGGEIIRLFDPSLHEFVPLPESEGITKNIEVDERWIRIRRPTIVVGGELTLSSLEATLNPITGILEAPVHIKSNCGCMVVDDFGRQQMSTTELLNRWIIPMESNVDYLILPSGRQVNMPFEQLLIFSTNLEPSSLCDEAFLRRIPYKIEVFDPTEQQFLDLFAEIANTMGFEVQKGVVEDLVEYHYKRVGRPFRFCHVKDLMSQARDFCEFHRKPFVLTRDIAELAVLNYFSGMQIQLGV